MDTREQLIKNLIDARKLAYAEFERLADVVDRIDKNLIDLGVDLKDNKEVSGKSIPPQATTPEQNLAAVLDILRSYGGPMRRRDIAERAYTTNRIVSTGGSDGVDAVVGNILSRNEPRLFLNTGWGWWTFNKHAETNEGEPLKFPIAK
jgi:hypothetical protein